MNKAFSSMMIQSATIEEIETHLCALGAGNHSDNMTVIRGFPRHYTLELSEADFMDLIFLQIKPLAKIVPARSDRRLRAVAERASKLKPEESDLGANWNIAQTLARFRDLYLSQPLCRLPALVVRDTRGAEREWAPHGWYLQDGSHRALGYCAAILTGETQYVPQRAFCATAKHM